MNTMQEELDAVVQHLYKQGRPAAEDGTCKYRTADGLMCAVGCRIPDEAYSPLMDADGGFDATIWLSATVPDFHKS